MDVTTFPSHVLLKNLTLPHQEVASEALPLSLEDCGAGFDQQRIPEWCCVIPEALRTPCTLSCSTVSRMHSGAWISMEEVPLLWGHPAGETTESQRETHKVPRMFQPTSLWVSLPGTCPVREWDSSWYPSLNTDGKNVVKFHSSKWKLPWLSAVNS